MVTGSSLSLMLLSGVWFLLRALDEKRRIRDAGMCDGKLFHKMIFFGYFNSNLTIFGEQILWILYCVLIL